MERMNIRQLFSGLGAFLLVSAAGAATVTELTPEQSAALRPALAGEMRVAADQAALVQALKLVDENAASGNAARIAERLVEAAPYRFAGTPAYDMAQQWAMKTLRQSGLVNVHTEAITVPRWERGCVSKALKLPANAGAGTPQCPGGDVALWIAGKEPEPLTATALGGSVATPADGISAPVLAVDSIEALQAQPFEAIKGRIVYFKPRMARRADGSGYGEIVTVRTRGAAEAGRRGALAVVIRSVGTNEDDVPHTGAMRYDEAAPKIPAVALSSKAADLLEQRLAAGVVSLKLRVDARMRGEAASANVIGEIAGETPEIVLLVAHLDSWDITPGANDDGAGVGIVVAALRMLAASGQKPRRTIRVLLTANEEFGLSGADAYARAHAKELEQHALALEADFGSGAVQTLHAGLTEADWPRIGAWALALKAQGVALGSNGGKGGPDLKSLLERGVPVLGPRQDGTLYFDMHHTTQDTPDKLDRAGIDQASRVYAVLAWTAANVENGFARMPLTAAP